MDPSSGQFPAGIGGVCGRGSAIEIDPFLQVLPGTRGIAAPFRRNYDWEITRPFLGPFFVWMKSVFLCADFDLFSEKMATTASFFLAG